MAYRKKTTGKTWVKNFGRSVMFGIGDAMKTQMPAVTSVLSDDNIEYMRSMKETINDIRRGQLDLAKYFEDQENGKEVVDAGKDLVNAGSEAIKNFIKTGNASLDKETQERMEAKMMGFDEDDFDFGDDDDFEKSIMRDIKTEDIDLSPIEEKTAEIGAAQVEATNRGTKATVQIGKATLNELGGIKSNIDTQTSVLATGMARSNQLNAKIAMSNANILASLNQKTISALGNINQNIATIVGFNNDTLMRQAEATMTYYTDSLSELRKISATLERACPPEGKRNDSESAYSQAGFSSYSSNFNLEGYLKNVKSNLKNTTAGMLVESLLDPTTLRMLASNPVQTVVSTGIEMLTPKILNETMKAVDQSFSNMIPAIIGKITDYGDDNDGILGTIARIFGMDLSSRRKGVRAYNKGAVPFDGITHKTINLVIPRYLSQIVSLLGGEAKMFDHESGTFKTEAQMKESVESDRRSAAKDAIGYDTMDYIDKEIKSFAEASSKSNKALAENLDKIQKATHEFLFTMVQAKDGRRTVDLGSADQFKNIDPELAKVMPGLPEFIRQIMLNATAGMKNQFRASRYHYAENVRERTGNRSAGDYREPILADNYYSNGNDTRFELSKDKKERLEHLNDKKAANNGKLTREEEKELRDILRLKERLESGDIEFGGKIKGKSTGLTVGKNSLFANYYQPMLDKMDMTISILRDISSASTNAAPIKGKRKRKKPTVAESAKSTTGGASVSFDELQEEEQEEKNKKFRKLMSNPGDSSDEADNIGSLADKYKEFKADQKEKELEALEDKVDAISDKQDENSRGFFSTMKMVLQSPAKALSQFLTGVDNTLYNLFFSDEKNKDGNESLIAHIMKPIKEGITSTFHGIVKTLNEEFFSPLKRIFYQDIIEGGLKQSFLNGMQSVRDWFNADYDEDTSSKKSSAAGDAAKKAASGIADAVAGGSHNAFGRHYATGRTDDPAYTAGVSAAARGDARVIQKTGYYSDASGKMILSKGERYLPDGTIIPAHHALGGKSTDLKNENEAEQQIMTQAVADGTSATANALERVNDAIDKVAENTAQSADIAKKQDKREEKQEKEASVKKPNSIKNSLSAVMSDIKNSLNEYIFGKNTDEKGNQKPFKDQVIDMFAVGFRNFNDFFFGKDLSLGDDKQSIEKYKKSFRESIPKGIARGLVFGGALALTAPLGGFGALGSLFLPGGIVGSAVLGLGVGMLTENRRIMNWLFGEKTPTGERVGGKIPKTITNFVKDNKTTLLGGFGVGVANTLFHFFTGNTILGSMLGMLPGGGAVGILPGLATGFFGPVTLSVGAALLMRSSKVQSMLFGTTDEKTGKKIGGLANNKIMQELKGKFPNIAAGAAVGTGVSVLGSQFGVLGSMMLGPYSAAILGGLVGFGLTSKKFKEAMFGKQDARGNFISGGLSDMIQNFFKAEVFNPAANFFQKEFVDTRAWFHQSVLAPILKSFSIYKDFGKYVAKSIVGHIKGVFETITGRVKSIFSPILDPLGKVFSFLVRNIRDTALGVTHAVSGISRSLISAPIKLLSLPATMIGSYYRLAGNEEQKAAMKEINAKDKARKDKWKEEDDKAKEELDKAIDKRNKNSKDLRKNGYEATPDQLKAKTEEYRKKQLELASINLKNTKAIIDNQTDALNISKSINTNVAAITEKLTGKVAAATASQKLVSSAFKKRKGKGVKAKALNDKDAFALVAENSLGVDTSANSAAINMGGVTNAITPIASPMSPLKPNEKDKSLTAAGQIAERKEEGFRSKLLSMLGSIKGIVKGGNDKKDDLFDQLKKLLKGLALFGGLGSLINGLLNGKDVSNLVRDIIQTVVKETKDEAKNAFKNSKLNSLIKKAYRSAVDSVKKGIEKITGRSIEDWAKLAKNKKTAVGHFLGDFAATGRNAAERATAAAADKMAANASLQSAKATERDLALKATQNLRSLHPEANFAEDTVLTDEKLIAQNLTEEDAAKYAKAKASREAAEKSLKSATEREADLTAKSALESAHGLFGGEANKAAAMSLESIGTKFGSIAESEAVEGTTLKTSVCKGVASVMPKIAEVLKNHPKIFNFFNNIPGLLAKTPVGRFASFAGRIAGAVGKTVSAVIPGVNLVNAAFAVWGGVEGYNNAAEMFHVNESDVTPGMRVTATIMQGLLSIGGFVWIDLALEIAGICTDRDPKRYLLKVIYSFIAGENGEDVDALSAKSDADFKAWKKIAGNEEKTWDDFINEQKNQSGVTGVANRFVDRARSTKIGGFLFGNNDENGNYHNGLFGNMKEDIMDHPIASAATLGTSFLLGGPAGVLAVAGAKAAHTALFGAANDDGTMTKGLLTDTKVGKAWNSGLAWMFGDKGAEARKQTLDLGDPTVKRDLLIAAIGPEAALIYNDDQIAKWDPTSGQFPDGKIMTDDQNAEIQTAIDKKNQQIDKDTYDLSRGVFGKAKDAALAWIFGDKDADKNVQILDLNNFDVKRDLAVIAFGDDAMMISDEAIANWDPTSGTAPDGQLMTADQQQAINDYVAAKNQQTQDAADKAKQGLLGRLGNEIGNTLAWLGGDPNAKAQLLDTGDPKVKMALLIRAGYDPNMFSYDSIVEWDPYGGTLPDGNIMTDDENSIISQYIDNYNKEANKAAIDKQNGALSTGLGNILSDIFGEEDSSYDENGTYKYNIIHRMEYAVENNLAYVFGYDVDPDTLEWTERDDNKFLDDIKSQAVNTIVGVPMNLIESIAGIKFTDEERANNVKTLEGYLFGKNDENGNYVPGLFSTIFDSLKEIFNNSPIGQTLGGVWDLIKRLFNATLGSLFSSDEQVTTIDNDTGEVTVENTDNHESFIDEYILTPLEDALNLEPDYFSKKIEGAWDSLMVSIFGTPKKLTAVGKISSFLYNGLLGTAADAIKYAWYKLKVGVASLGDKVFGTNHADEVEKYVYNGGMATYKNELRASDSGSGNVYVASEGSEYALSSASDSSDQMEGNGDYSQNDSRWKNKNYSGTPFGGTGCGPTVMASVLQKMGKNVNPYELGTAAGAAGYKTSGGTNEKFLPDAANTFGVKAKHLNSMDDIVNNVNSGKQVVVGGMSGSGYGLPFTPAGHYSRIDSINGNTAILADPRGYKNQVSLNELGSDTKTAYAFSGNGDGTTEYGMPDFSQIDDSQGLLPGVYNILKNWFMAGGPFYTLKRTIQTGFTKFKESLFGKSDDENGGLINYVTDTEGGLLADLQSGGWIPNFSAHIQTDGAIPGIASATWDWIKDGAFYGAFGRFAKHKIDDLTKSLFGVSISEAADNAINYVTDTEGGLLADLQSGGWIPNFSAHVDSEGLIPGIASATWDWIKDGAFYGAFGRFAKHKIDEFTKSLFGVSLSDAADNAINYVTDTEGGLLANLQSDGWVPNFAAHYSEGMIPGAKNAIWEWIVEARPIKAFAKNFEQGLDTIERWVFGDSEVEAAGDEGIIKYKVDNTLAWIFGEKQEDGTVKGGAFEGPYNWIVENTKTYITDPLSETFNSIATGYDNLTEGFNKWAEGAEKEINDNGIVVGGFNILKDLVSGLWGAVWDNSTIQGAVQNAESYIESGFQAIADFGNGLIEPFQEAWKQIKDFKPTLFIATILSKAIKKGMGASVANQLRGSIASFFDVDEDDIEKGGGGIGGHVPSSTTRRANNMNYLMSYASTLAGSGSDNGAGTYTQNDSAWASHQIADNTGNMASIGCGPTTAANALNSALGMNITPEQTARMITSRDIPTNGTRGVTANYFPDTVSKLGGEFIALNPNDKASVTNALADGYTLVAGGQSKSDSDSSTFTQAGHYTMLKGGYTRSGNPYTYSYDPLGGNRNKSVRISDMLTDVRRGGPSMIGIVAPRGMGVAKGINGVNLTALGAGGSGGGLGNFNGSYIDKYESKPGATDLDSVQPDVSNLFNQVAKDYYDQTGSKLTITGGAEKGYHAPGEFGHEGGWKLDVDKAADVNTLLPILNKYKIAAGDEGDHYDLSFNSGKTGGSLITDNATGPFAGNSSGNSNNKSGNNKAPKKQDPFSTFASRFAQVAKDYTMSMLLGKTYTGSTFEDESSGSNSGGNYSGNAVDPVPSNVKAANIANGISAKTGIPAKLIWSQLAFEVGGFDNLSNGLMTEDHNYGGVKASGDAKRSQYNAPAGEGGGAYRHFDSDEEFIDYQAKNYKAYANDGLLDAKSPADFAAALKRGGYYQSDESDYAAGMDRWYKEVGGAGLLGGAGIVPLLNYYRMGGSGGENKSVKDSIDAIVGQSMSNGTVGCAEATVKMGAGYSDFFKKLRDSGVASVEGVIGAAESDGIGIVPYDANSLAPGDAVTYDNGTPREQVTVPDDDSHNNHIGLFEEMRNGVPWGADNSSKQNQVVERAIPRDWQNPAWILKTGDGSAGSSGSSSGKSKGKQDKFSTFASRFAQVAKDYTMSIMLGKTYTGSTFDDGGSTSGSATVTGENAKDTWNYLTGTAGFSKEDAAAIMGNFQLESGMDPKKVEGGGEADNITVGGPGYGLAQWTSQSRQQNLADYAASQNKPSGDLGVQLEFFNKEAHDNYSGAISSMNAASSIADKTESWMTNYEGPDPSTAHLSDRQKSAQDFFNAYSGGSGGAGFGGSSAPSIADLTQQYNLQYDEYGNLKGYKGDESLLNNGTEDLQTRYHNQAQQVYAFLRMNPSGRVLSPLAALGMKLFGVIPGRHVSNGTAAANPENTSLVNAVGGMNGMTSVGSQLVKELCKKYNITADKFDRYLNLNIPGFTIPDNLKITDKDKNPTEIYHKQGQQIFLYAKSQGYQGNLPMDPNAGTPQEQIAGVTYYYDNNGALRRVPNIADNIKYRIGNEGIYGPRRVYLENMRNFSSNSKDPNRALQYGLPIKDLESGHYKVDQNGRVHRRGIVSKLFPYLSDKMYQMKDNRSANRVENDLYRDLDMVRASYNGASGGSGKSSNRAVYGPKTITQYYIDRWDSKRPQRLAALYKKYGNIDYDLDGWRNRYHYGDAKMGPLSKADQEWRDAGHNYSYADYTYLSPFQMAGDRVRRALDDGDGPFTMQTTERIASVSDKYKLEYDGYGNLIGYDGPAQNIIDGTEDEVVKYSKQAKQIALYLAKHKPPVGGIKQNTNGDNGTTSKGATVSAPDKNTQLIQELCKTYGIKFDIMNNIKNTDFTIPDEMRITGKEKDLTEVYHKQGLQVFAYAKQKGWTGTPPASALNGAGSAHFKEIFMRSGLGKKFGIGGAMNNGTLVTPNGVKLGTYNGTVPKGYRVDIYGNLQKRRGWLAKLFPKQYDQWHTMKERRAYNKMLNNPSIAGTTSTANDIEKMSAADIAKLYGMTSVNFDQCMNVKMPGFTIPADLVITPEDNETTKYHKQGLQLKLYAKQHPEALKSQNTTTNTQSDDKSKKVSEITTKYDIQYNALGNVNMPGFDVPSNLLITEQDGADSPEKYEKQYQQILAYEKWKTGTDGNANLAQRQTHYDIPKTVNSQVTSNSNVYTPNTAMATGQTSTPVNNLRSVNYSAGQSAADRYAQREYQANNNDLINAIHSLDVHAELQYMCETLKVIAGNQVSMNKNMTDSNAATSAKLSTVASLAAKTAASGGSSSMDPSKAPSPGRKRKAGTSVGNDYASIHNKNLEIARGGNFAVS